MKAMGAVMAMLWVGCVATPEPPEIQPVEKKPDLSAGRVNSLGMRFVTVAGLNPNIQFAVWETRVKDYAAFAIATEGVNERWQRTGFKQSENHPATFVNVADAQAFCAWLTKKELAEGGLSKGQRYRLPTDAEWTTAMNPPVVMVSAPAKAVERSYPWGENFPPINAGNYGVRLRQDHVITGFVPGNSLPVPVLSVNLKGDLFVYTSPVGSFAPDTNGLHDLGGNVREWCVKKDPPRDDSFVLRGASWRDNNATDLALPARVTTIAPDSRGVYGANGFRCVLDLGDTIKPPPPVEFVNSIGMRFIAVKDADVQFSVLETRVQDFEKFARATDLPDTWRTPQTRGATMPAVNVSWHEAKQFCVWLTEVDQVAGRIEPGMHYRLPADVEWSRAVGLKNEFGATPQDRDLGNEGQYPWGRAWPPPAGAGNFGGVFGTPAFAELSGVGSFPANENQLRDMGGNAWEWVEDPWFAGSALRVLRGAWRGDNRRTLQSSHRFFATPQNRGPRFGFRVVLAKVPQP